MICSHSWQVVSSTPFFNNKTFCNAQRLSWEVKEVGGSCSVCYWAALTCPITNTLRGPGSGMELDSVCNSHRRSVNAHASVLRTTVKYAADTFADARRRC